MDKNTEKVLRLYQENISIERLTQEASAVQVEQNTEIEVDFYLKVNNPSSVLEVGPGYGRLVSGFLDRGVEYFGIEIVPSYAQYCREKYPTANLTEGDFFESLFEEGFTRKFDQIIFPWNVLNHYCFETQQKAIIKSLETGSAVVVGYRSKKEVLKPGFPKVQMESRDEGFKLKLHLQQDQRTTFKYWVADESFYKKVANIGKFKVEFSKIKVSDSYFLNHAVFWS